MLAIFGCHRVVQISMHSMRCATSKKQKTIVLFLFCMLMKMSDAKTERKHFFLLFISPSLYLEVAVSFKVRVTVFSIFTKNNVFAAIMM